jgi:Raf kinase inhibitor-like YbhB/YbcL family protein
VTRAIWVCAALVLLACSDDGRELQPPSADQTTTLPTTSTSVAAAAVMTFSSPSFAAGAAIPAEYTCDGESLSPALAWADLPDAAVELVVIVTDPDADGFVHWVIAGLDPASLGVDPGTVPEGAVEATNDAGSVGWTGPCPPPDESHQYVFTLYALAEPLGLQPGLAGRQAAELAQQAALANATFTANYART